MLRLVAGDAVLELDDPDAGFVFQNIDFGAPDIREVATNRPGADGTDDYTALVGARAITVNLEVLAGPSSKQQLVDQVSRFLHAKTRLDLYHASETGGPVRRIRVRPAGHTLVKELDEFWPFSVAFKSVGSPYLYGESINQVSVAPLAAEAGLSLDLTFDVVFPGSASSAVIIHNAGDQPANWTARIYGPVTGPRIRNESKGVELSFPTLVIGAGSYVEVSSENRTVLDGGTTSRYSTLDFLNSSWWLLDPGDNAITMPTSIHNVPAQAQFSWFDTYLT